MSDVSKLAKTAKGLTNLAKTASALVDQLERSQALEALWPDVFDAGKVISRWIATPTGQTIRGMVVYTLKLTVVNGDGQTRTFTRDEVPDCLPSPKKHPDGVPLSCPTRNSRSPRGGEQRNTRTNSKGETK